MRTVTATEVDLEALLESKIRRRLPRMFSIALTVPVLISAPTRAGVDDIETALWSYLKAHGYRKSSASELEEFEGSFWKKFRLTVKFGDWFHLDLARKENSGETAKKETREQSTSKEKLEKVVAVSNGLLILGTGVLAGVAYWHELTKQYHEAYPSQPASKTIPVEEHGPKKPKARPPHRRHHEGAVVEKKLPARMVPVVRNTNKENVSQFKFLLGFTFSGEIDLPPQQEPPKNSK